MSSKNNSFSSLISSIPTPSSISIGRSRISIGEIPWVTVALIVAAIALTGMPPSDVRPGEPAPDPFVEASLYWRSHPHVAVSPRFIDRVVESLPDTNPVLAREALRELGRRNRPVNAQQRETEQAQMDALIARVRVSNPIPGAAPGTSWSLEGAAAITANALATQLIHPLPLTLGVSILLLVIFGASAEMRWGHFSCALVFAGSATLAALGQGLAGSGSTAGDGALATTSALALSQLLGPTTGGFTAYGFRPSRRGIELLTLSLSRWMAAACWITLTLVACVAGLVSVGGFPYFSLASGLVVGLGLRLLARRNATGSEVTSEEHEEKTNPVELPEPAAIDPTPSPQPPSMEDWIRRVEEDPADVQSALALEKHAHASGRLDEAAPVLTQHLASRIRQGELPDAAKLWCRLNDLVVGFGVGLTPEQCVRLIPKLMEQGQREPALALLERSLNAPAAERSAGLALRILGFCEELDAPTTPEAARRALAFPDLHPSKRERIQALLGGPPQEADAAIEREAEQTEGGRLGDPSDDPRSAFRAAPTHAPAPALDALPASPEIEKLRASSEARSQDPEAWSPEGELEIPDTWDREPPEYLDSAPEASKAPALDSNGGLDLSPDLVTPNPDATFKAVGGMAPPPIPTRAARTKGPASAGENPTTAASSGTRTAISEAPGASTLAGLPRFDSITTVDALPIELASDVLYFRLPSGRRAKVAWTEIEAIGVAAVRDLSRKPVVVIDLLLNWNEARDSSLRSVRLRSDRFNPRHLIGDVESPTESLRSFLRELALRTSAEPLPDTDASRGRPFRAYRLLRDYQRQVLKVDC